MPMENMAATPSFDLKGIWSLEIDTNGRIRIATSEIMLIALAEVKVARLSMHLPSKDGFHIFSRGMQAQMSDIVNAV